MNRLFALSTVLLALAFSKSTISDTKKLFRNTIKKWNINVKNKRDYRERYNRLVKTVENIEKTTTGVLLDSLNRFSVNNDEEQAAMLDLAFQAANLTQIGVTAAETGGLKISPFESKGVGSGLPTENEYWEKELGMSDPQDQASCGACWSFPTAAALEAVYRKLTGDFVVFSKQYFIDCTFSYSGCAGGRINDGFIITTDRQFLMSEEDWPTTSDYQTCKFRDQIREKKENAMQKTWLQDWYPLSKNELGLLNGLALSPVAFGSFISMNYYGYSGGVYDDSLCATQAIPHAQLLVGYTKDYLRVRGSYGKWWGDEGYINYKRGSQNLVSCKFYDTAYTIAMTHRRDVNYEFCSEAKAVTRGECLESCEAMNKKGETGWALATIPTVQHNNQLVTMVNSRFPGVKSDDKFNLLWIGLEDPEKSENYKWSHDYVDVNYFNFTSQTGVGKFGLLNKNTGGWVMKNSLTFQARGLCSRAETCRDISSEIVKGKGYL
ncbi:hypothetical protein ACHWQZ_G006506 [Mnemiopsis leidyi]